MKEARYAPGTANTLQGSFTLGSTIINSNKNRRLQLMFVNSSACEMSSIFRGATLPGRIFRPSFALGQRFGMPL
jgi:hypothetical protein